jgi:hypothetical protein
MEQLLLMVKVVVIINNRLAFTCFGQYPEEGEED